MLRPWLKFWKTTPLWRNTLRKISELKLIVLRQETRWEWLGLAMSHFSWTGLGCERLHRLLPTVPPPPPPHRWCGRSPPPGRHHPSRQVIISASLFSLLGILSHIFSHIYVSHISCYHGKLVRFRGQYPLRPLLTILINGIIQPRAIILFFSFDLSWSPLLLKTNWIKL